MMFKLIQLVKSRCWFVLVLGVLAIPCAPGRVLCATGTTTRPFNIGVYVNGDTHPQNLPPSRMLADMAGHGITRAVLLPKQYMQLAPLGLNSLAKQWGIGLYIGNIGGGSAEVDEPNMRMIIKLVNSYPDSDAVKGWYAADEVEAQQTPKAEKYLSGFVSMIRRLDPNRRVIVNHDARTQGWGGRFAALGEDESWCSVFWANHYATAFLRKTMAVHRAAYGEKSPPLTFVYGAQSTNTFNAEQNLIDAGLAKVKLADLKALTTRADITDYILTAFKLGASGASFFVYDGYYDWTFYTLVDARGQSVNGKMEGIRDAADQIAATEGRPGLGLEVKEGGTDLSITIATLPRTGAVKSVQVELSHDGGYTWMAIGGFGPTGGAVKHTVANPPLQRPYWSMVRARCFDGQNYSLWSVWNVFPWRAPRASE